MVLGGCSLSLLFFMIPITLSMAHVLQINKFNPTAGTTVCLPREIAWLSIEILLAQKLRVINVFLGPLPPLRFLGRWPARVAWMKQEVARGSDHWFKKSQCFSPCNQPSSAPGCPIPKEKLTLQHSDSPNRGLSYLRPPSQKVWE